jgi:hypothetical protein
MIKPKYYKGQDNLLYKGKYGAKIIIEGSQDKEGISYGIIYRNEEDNLIHQFVGEDTLKEVGDEGN